jgi:hypothetical protein
LVSIRPSTTFFTALTLFDTGAYTSFVNREVAKWLEQRQREGKTTTTSIVQQDQVLRETTARLEEREKMGHDLAELNDINRLLITRYQEHENFEADLEDEDNSRSSRD